MGVLRCICSPFELFYHSIQIYIFPIIKYYCYKFVCCIPLFRCCFLYTDAEFNEKNALGEHYEGWDDKIEWKRCYDIKGATLISNQIKPSDVLQGGIGDCWLMSAIACLAEYHGPLHNLFDSHSISIFGKYKIKLYNKSEKRWETLIIDDKIPFMKATGKPLFAQCKDNEMWVLLLEKAFAKFVGNYSKLKGGSIAWGLQVLTGDYVMSFHQSDRSWQKFRMVNMNKEINPQSVTFLGTSEKFNCGETFDILKEYDKEGSLLSTYASCNALWKHNSGIITKHAYSILRIEEIGNYKLLQLRNPWGRFEWSGDWSDKSAKWKENPYVRMRLQFEDKNDGVFWISWYDFQSIFTDIDICHKSFGKHDLILDIHEGVCCGPMIGCTKGCFSFWCCCNGCKALYFPHKSSQSTLKVKKRTCILL